MKTSLLSLLFFIFSFAHSQDYVIVLHGGAGDGIKKENINAEQQKLYEEKMEEALAAGANVLDTGGLAYLAVVEVIKLLEDSPLFNAGKGAVFTYDEKNEMDASIMDGQTLNAGAVAGIGVVKNPITVALAVMENSTHVMLSRKGAEEFAKMQGCEIVSPDYFHTEKSLNSLKRYKKTQGAISGNWEDTKMGTVGCAVLDKHGNLAAGTSTGGMTGKRYGRIGDSPIIGAGTYADNNTCAISCTGHGEYFIRYAVAHDVSSRMAYGNKNFKDAAAEVIHKVLKPAGGAGGLIGVDRDGNVVMEYNTSGMFRAYRKQGQKAVVEMF